jgi:hypothetical protein
VKRGFKIDMAAGIAQEEEDPSLIREALLGEVFKLLPFEERLQSVPLECKSWRKVSLDPACWTHVDMNGWFTKRVRSDLTGLWEFDFSCDDEVEFCIKRVVDLSAGKLRELQTMRVQMLPFYILPKDALPSFRSQLGTAYMLAIRQFWS